MERDEALYVLLPLMILLLLPFFGFARSILAEVEFFFLVWAIRYLQHSIISALALRRFASLNYCISSKARRTSQIYGCTI